jgi:pimeloyl-ACP methyl ester carboxylesterase
MEKRKMIVDEHGWWRALLLVAAFAGLACGVPPDTPSGEADAGGNDAGLEPGRHVFTTADGNEMPYVVTKGGQPTVILIHCWMCERSFWEAQLPALEGRYRTVRVDLPGHGEATARRDAWTVEAYGHDIAGLLRQLDIDGVILVGHSMGGPVALKAAALAPGRVKGIVAVDTLHDAEFNFDSPQVEGAGPTNRL